MKSRVVFFSILLVFAATLPPVIFSQENQKPAATAEAQQPPVSSESSPQAQEPKIKHPGGKDDVNAIGTRKLGGMDWYSWDREIQIGNALAQQLEQNTKMVEDPVINEYVNRIGQNLVRNSDVKIPVTIKILDADEPNAMTLLGGHLYVNSGLLLAADEEDELAGVMAHEIGHIAARHGSRGATRAELLSILQMAGSIFVPGGLGAIVRQGIGAGLPMAMFKFSRAFE